MKSEAKKMVDIKGLDKTRVLKVELSGGEFDEGA